MSDRGVNFISTKQDTNNAEDFVVYLGKLLLILKDIHGDDLSEVIIFLDGSPLHFSLKTRNFLIDNKVKALMNCRYTPEFNAAEEHIRAEKMMLREKMSLSR